MGGVITETRGRAFHTIGRTISFLLNPQKLGRVFKARLRVSKAQCFDHRTFLII